MPPEAWARALLDLGALLLLGGRWAGARGAVFALGALAVLLGSGLSLLHLGEALGLAPGALLEGRLGVLLLARALGVLCLFHPKGLLPGALLLLPTLGATAHPQDRGPQGLFLGFLHAGAALLWAGGVVHLALAPEGEALRRLARFAPWAVLTLFLSGLLLAGPALAKGGPYRNLLVLKGTLFLLALGCAALNRRELPGSKPKALLPEALALLLATALAALLATTPP